MEIPEWCYCKIEHWRAGACSCNPIAAKQPRRRPKQNRIFNWYNFQRLIPDWVALRLPERVRSFIYWRAVKNI